jgi:DNA repair exonuclease SbcCD ATPase subunit
LAIDNWELFSGTIKNWAGSIIQWAMPAIKLMLQGLAELVGVFSDDLEAKINQSITDIDNFSKQLVISGEAQVKAAEAAELHAESEAKVSEEMQKSANAAEEQQQQLIRLKTEYNQLSIGAERAFDSVKEFTPRINLNKFLQDAESYKESLNKLMSKGVELAAADPSQRARILQDNADTAEAIKAFNLKIAQEERNAKVKEVEIGLQLQRQAIIGEEEQIALLKIQKAQELRSQLVQIKTQQLMEEREIQQNALSVDQEAQLAARNKELENYRTSLEFEKTMAVDIELQKQAELAAIKAQATQGLGGSAEAGGGAKQAIVQEQMRQAELTRQVKAGEIERADFERAMDASRANERKAANAEELALAQERTALLGQHELAFREQQKIAEAAYKEQLKVIEETESIQGEEKKIAREEAEMNHLANMQSIREQNLQQEIARNEKLGNSWDATLSRIKLAQLQHGKAMGFLIAWQASRENQAIQSGLSAGSELMQSEHKKQFEIGKAAAIAQTTMNTAMAAVMAFTALAGIPIVGPALAFSMAALITAAGLMRLQQIRNTQFKGGQADEGMTEIPQSMHGKSFVMAGGERVIKTNQNKDLTSALERINSGETQNNNNISITVNGNANEDTVRDMRDTIVQILRDQSDRGRPIMNERGLVR